jgi:ABC-type bacteriocin/lantibiotic exporter with double-glycine peptidase domain
MLRIKALVIAAAVVTIAAAGAFEARADGSPAGPGRKVIDGVPFVKQKDDYCGPAAMASIMQFYGNEIGQDVIAEAVFTPGLDGALISDMENYAKAQGYRTEAVNGSRESLRAVIDEGAPAILLVDRGKWKVSVPHYYVVYGYDSAKKTFILHTGEKGGQEISYDKLNGEWKKMNRLMLVIRK